MKTRALFPAVPLLLVVLLSACPSSASASPKALGPPVAVSGIFLQPPAGYSVLNAPSAPAGAFACAWVGPRRIDGTHPTLEMALMNIPAGQTARATLPFLSDNFLRGKKRITTNWRVTPAQPVMIHGLRFLRTCWAGNDSQTGIPMSGIQFVARDHQKIVLFASQDPQCDGTEGIALAQAAILTVHR
jgi:hypothetical protein